jgi:mannose-6-phosphate isomerase-like protein (cupin superfamily)
MTVNSGWAQINFDDVTDLAVGYGMQELGEARYLREQVGAEATGLTLYRMRAGRRTGFGHRHDAVEEMYVVLSGSGRVKIDDDVVDLRPRDVVRVAPACVREFEAGSDGMELLATGAHVDGDGEMLQEWWPVEP